MDYKVIVFVIAGIAAGWMVGYIKSLFKLRKYKKEIKELNGHLNRQMRIIDEGSKGLEKELQNVKKRNENLNETVNTLKQKPGRAELRLLNIYDLALKKMKLNAPGFFSAWEATFKDAEIEYEGKETGSEAIKKKILSPDLSNKSSVLEQETD